MALPGRGGRARGAARRARRLASDARAHTAAGKAEAGAAARGCRAEVPLTRLTVRQEAFWLNWVLISRVTKATKISKLGSISDMLRALITLALQFATATANLAPQNAFLFLATHGPIFIASSSSATLNPVSRDYAKDLEETRFRMAELVEAAWKKEWEKVEVRWRPFLAPSVVRREPEAWSVDPGSLRRTPDSAMLCRIQPLRQAPLR